MEGRGGVWMLGINECSVCEGCGDGLIGVWMGGDAEYGMWLR